MSNQQSSFTSMSSVSYSSGSTQDGQHESGTSHSQTSYRDDSGSHTITESQNLGEAPVRSEKHYDASGNELVGNGAGNRIEDVSEEQKERDREYEERMEDEYAKREGGA